MQHRVGMAIICLHISAAIYLLLGVLGIMLLTADLSDEELTVLGGVLLVVSLPLAVFIEIVVYGLRRRRLWAWIAGLCLFAIYLPSLFLPLGALGLWGLLDPGSRAAFGIGGGTAASGG